MSWPTACGNCENAGPFYCGTCIAHYCLTHICAHIEDKRGDGMRTTATPHSKLTAKDVLEIRKTKGLVPYKVTAEKYGIHFTRVAQIVNGHAWKWLKPAAVAITLLIVGAAGAGAQESELVKMLNACDTSVAAFLSPNTAPRTECEYALNNVVVMQKVEDGYLLISDFDLGIAERGAIFLKTKAPLPKNARFNGERVRPAGTYSYQGIDGFEKQVWAFDVIIPQGAKAITQ